MYHRFCRCTVQRYRRPPTKRSAQQSMAQNMATLPPPGMAINLPMIRPALPPGGMFYPFYPPPFSIHPRMVFGMQLAQQRAVPMPVPRNCFVQPTWSQVVAAQIPTVPDAVPTTLSSLATEFRPGERYHQRHQVVPQQCAATISTEDDELTSSETESDSEDDSDYDLESSDEDSIPHSSNMVSSDDYIRDIPSISPDSDPFFNPYMCMNTRKQCKSARDLSDDELERLWTSYDDPLLMSAINIEREDETLCDKLHANNFGLFTSEWSLAKDDQERLIEDYPEDEAVLKLDHSEEKPNSLKTETCEIENCFFAEGRKIKW